MFAGIISLGACLYFNTSFRDVLVNGTTRMLISTINLFQQIKEVYGKYITHREVIYDLLRGGMTWSVAGEFIVYNIRNYIARRLESGHLVVKRNHYELTYYDGSRKYQIRFPKHRGVRQIVRVRTCDGEDITEDVIQLLGPSHNFHGIPTTPEMLGYPALQVFYRGGTVRTIPENTVIPLKPL